MYQLPKLKNYPNLIHAFSNKSDGNMSFKFGSAEKVVQNRKNFLAKLGIDIKDCVKTDLEKKDNIVTVKTADKSSGMFGQARLVGDAMITDKQGVFLFLLVADCLPILLFNPKHKLLAVIHSGWQGTDLEITKKVVKQMSKLGSKAGDLIAGIGPAINKSSYVRVNPLQKNNPSWQPYLKNLGSGQYSIDLIGYNIAQLTESSIPEKNIEISNIDTAKSKDFFSHDQSKKTGELEGRFALVAGMI